MPRNGMERGEIVDLGEERVSTEGKMPRRRGPEVLFLRISLKESVPQVWRRVLVHSDTTLQGLHRVIQILMEWQDYHLYEFVIRGERYEEQHDEAEGLDPAPVTLGSLRLEKGERFEYTYDFGDGWEHEIVVERRKRARREFWLPWVEAGERAGPPEDCGGILGFEEFLEALADPEHPEHERYRDWVGADYDPVRFDRRNATHFLRLAEAWGVLR